MFIKYIMSTNDFSYQETLNKMAELQDLAATVEDTSAKLSEKKQNLMRLIGDCNKQVNALQDNIGKIKGQGSQAKEQVQTLIKKADERQTSTIQKLKSSIEAMSNTDQLEKQLDLLKDDINKIARVMDTPGPGQVNINADAAAAAAAAKSSQPKPYIPPSQRGKPPSSPPPTVGGYTYGKSRKRDGKRRRRRGKNSRKKGRGKR